MVLDWVWILFIRVSDSCGTWCSHCIQMKQNLKFYDFEIIKKNFLRVKDLINDKTYITITWWNALSHPNILEIIELITTNIKNTPNFHLTGNEIEKNELSVLYKIFKSYDVSIWIHFNLDVLSKFNFNNFLLLLWMIQKYWIKVESHVYYKNKSEFKNKFLYILKKYISSNKLRIRPETIIDDNKQTIIWKSNYCLYLDSFSFPWNSTVKFKSFRQFDYEVQETPDYEVDKNGDIIPHIKNRCYTWYFKVSNIYLSEKQILNHFKIFYEYLVESNSFSDNFSKNCYRCVLWKKVFDYNDYM